MKAAWYERQGPADEVLVIGEVPIVEVGPGEVRIRVVASGINPGDVKKRGDSFGLGMPFPRVIPHSDGSGLIDAVGDGVSASRLGERVWCFGAQSYRPFGTAAEYVIVPAGQAVTLPDGVSYATGNPSPALPFWPLVFSNVTVFFLGSDDFPPEAKGEAARSLNAALEGGWPGYVIHARLPLEQIARAHALVERGTGSGRVVLTSAQARS